MDTMTTTEGIRDYLGDFAADFTEDQISIITAAAIDVEERIIAKYGDMTLEERGVMMLAPLEAIVQYVDDETTLAKCVGDDERLEAALIAGAHSGRLTERLAEAAGIDLTKAQEFLGDLEGEAGGQRDGYASGIGWMGERLDGPRVGIAAS